MVSESSEKLWNNDNNRRRKKIVKLAGGNMCIWTFWDILKKKKAKQTIVNTQLFSRPLQPQSHFNNFWRARLQFCLSLSYSFETYSRVESFDFSPRISCALFGFDFEQFYLFSYILLVILSIPYDAVCKFFDFEFIPKKHDYL